jgi:membrane protease YdiL (CAAX protease family)
MQIPAWQPEYLAPILAWVFVCVGYSVFHFVSLSGKVRQGFISRYGPQRGAVNFTLFCRYLGGFTIGIIPAAVMLAVLGQPLSDFGVHFQDGMFSLYWVLALTTIFIFINYFNTQKEKHLAFYPNVRAEEWSLGLVANAALSWAVYLFGYELMFRGFLLFASIPLLGAWPAIVLNVVFYVLVHVPKNLEESIGSAPLGLLLCLITLTTGTIWVAVFSHIALAWSNLLFSIKHHPEMRLKRRHA